MKVVFFDADGTICHLRNGISEKNIEAFSRLKRAGYYTVLCTSRSMPFVTENLRNLGFDAYITSGGACIQTQEYITDYRIPCETVLGLMSVFEKYELIPILCGQNHILFNPLILNSDIDPWYDVIFEQIKNAYSPLCQYTEDVNINKICVKIGKNRPSSREIQELFAYIKSAYSCEITAGWDDEEDLVEFEITVNGRNKGAAVAEFLREAQKKDKNITTWALGDGTADISMFKTVDCSIAMGNAPNIVKEAATYVTERYEHDGMAVACEKIVMKNDVYEQIVSFSDISTDGILGFERFLIFDKAKWFDLFIKQKSIPPIQIDWQLSSSCNLRCRWCVGQSVNKDNELSVLADSMTLEKVNSIAKQIAQLCVSGISIETVQFSGFTGEPLIHWTLLQRAIEILKSYSVRIGIFTNGTLMDEKTWESLTNIESVHISLDGGTTTWKQIKNPKNATVDYKAIIQNIKGLVEYRNKKNSPTEINTGYTVTQDNIGELEATIQDLVNIGADSICIKYDITGNEELLSQQDCKCKIDECYRKYHSTSFKVLVMHDEAPDKVKNRWDCQNGCYYRYFFCTIGSDGNIYPCDYQTLNGCPSFGNISKTSFEEAYEIKKSKWDELVSSKQQFRNVCPPLAEVINPYLDKVMRLVDLYGSDVVLSAFQRIRDEYR